MRHAARQLRSWLIFDVRRSEVCISAACGEDGYMSASLHAFSCGVRTLLLHPRGWDRFTDGRLGRGESWKYSPRCERVECDRRGECSQIWRIRASLPRKFLRSAVSGRVNRRHSGISVGRARWPNKAPEPTPTAVTPRAIEMMTEVKQWICSRDEARVAPAVVVAHL
jgi:hypothetical protein